LLHGIRDPASGYLEYYATLEGDVEQMARWAHAAAESLYADSAQTAAEYRTAQILPMHDILYRDGQIEVAGRHLPRPPVALAGEGRAFARLYAIHRTVASGEMYWSAREVATVLGYRRWPSTVVQRAARASAASVDLTAHFRPSGASAREPADVHRSRLALDLVVQSANPRHVPVAQAQTYLAIQTRRAELGESVTPLAAGAPAAPGVLGPRRSGARGHHPISTPRDPASAAG
jgi:hypothetical protein